MDFWIVDKFNTLVACWTDNEIIFYVFIVHKSRQIIMCYICQPKETQKIQNHMDEVLRKRGKVEIMIPRLTDDYNHWMAAADLCE